MKISIRGFETGTTEKEIRESLEDYGVVVSDVNILKSEADDRYLAVLDLDTDEAGVKYLVKRLNGRVWKGKTLAVSAHLFMV